MIKLYKYAAEEFRGGGGPAHNLLAERQCVKIYKTNLKLTLKQKNDFRNGFLAPKNIEKVVL